MLGIHILAALLQMNGIGTPQSLPSPQPVQVWEWHSVPTLHEVGQVFPTDFPSNLSSFGSITCRLGEDRTPRSCEAESRGDPRLTRALLRLSDKFRGPPDSVLTGQRINIVYNFRAPYNVISDPYFVRGVDDIQGQPAKWGQPPTFDTVEAAMPEKLNGASSGGLECKVGDQGRLNACHIYKPSKVRPPFCGGMPNGTCTPEQLNSFIPAPELVKLALAVRAPETAPDGSAAIGWEVRFRVSVEKPLAPPLQIPPPILNPRQVVQELKTRHSRPFQF